jgi:hypothetical protein
MGAAVFHRELHTISYDSDTQPVLGVRVKRNIVTVVLFIRKEQAVEGGKDSPIVRASSVPLNEIAYS